MSGSFFKGRAPLIGITALGLVAVVALSAATSYAAATAAARYANAPDLAKITAALKLRLPKTPIGALTCKGLGGLCEVASKTTLFYVDRSARYLVIGRVYDMETRQDLTAARLLALNPDLLAAGAAQRETGASGDAAVPAPQRQAARPNVDPSGLPGNGAVVWGPENGPKVVVFSDFQCSYCKRLTAELAAIGARVEERPISIFGAAARKLAEQVICAPDPEAALHAAYAGRQLANSKRCDTGGLDANEAFAKAHGFGGTPVFVRPADGAVLEGFRDAATLRAFLAPPLPASPQPKG